MRVESVEENARNKSVFQEMKAQYGPEEMLYPNKQLYRYNIRNGDEIIIDSKLNRFASTSSATSSIRS